MEQISGNVQYFDKFEKKIPLRQYFRETNQFVYNLMWLLVYLMFIK